MTQDTAKIREFLIKQFNDGELDDLCFDHFPKVYDIIGGMDKSNKIRRLMDYCRRNGEFPRLLNLLKALRPAPYDEVFPTPKPEPDPPPPPVMQHPKGDNPAEAQGILRSADYAQNDMVSPPSVMLTLSNTKGKHPDGSDSAKAQGILRSADYAQNDRGWMRWLARLQTVPMPVWGVVVALLVLPTWVAYSSLNGNNPSVTPTTEVAQNSPAATQPVPPSVTPDITLTATLPPTSTHTPAPTVSATPPPPPPNAQLGDTWTRPTDGMVMVYVPSGSFLMGNTDAQIHTFFWECQQMYGNCILSVFDDEKPQHSVILTDFWIDRTEVTNTQYQMCVEAGACNKANFLYASNYSGAGNYPKVGASWYDASIYCQWIGGELPTEAQWEYVAKGPENHTYPWGDAFNGYRVNFCDTSCPRDWKDITVYDGNALTSPVGSYSQWDSWVGALDMVGNVWEWVQDWYAGYSASSFENPFGPTEGTYKVLRGGSWNSDRSDIRSTTRFYHAPDSYSGDIGFRCVVKTGN